MRLPERLKKGDLIGLVTPSSPTDIERTLRCKEFVEKMGYEVILGKSCMKRLHGYLAGNRFERAEDMNEMFLNPEVKGIFCIRGGYGSSEVMDLLDYESIARKPKVFVGYSDITNLNVAFNTLCNFITFHGPMVSSNMLEHYDAYTRGCFEEALKMQGIMTFHNPEGEPLKVISHGTAHGVIVGGNLAVFMNLLGTFYAPDLTGKILFIEDVYESVPRIHRMLDQLRLLGVFEKVAGIVIGDFSESENPDDESYLVEDFIQDYFSCSKIPVISNLKCGHCYPTATIPLGVNCKINTLDCKVELIFDE